MDTCSSGLRCRSALTSEVLPAPEGAAMTNRRPRWAEEAMGRETYTAPGGPDYCLWQKVLLQKGTCGALPLLGTDLQPLEVIPHDVAMPLAARHSGSTREHQYEIPSGCSADLTYVIRIYDAGTADTQHRLRLQRLLC